MVSSDADDPLVTTLGIEESTFGMRLWSVGPDIDLVDPLPIRLPDLPPYPDDHFVSDIRYEERTLRITVSAQAETDTECFTAGDRQTFVVGADDLGITEEELDVELGPGDTVDRYRTIVYRIGADGTGVAVHEFEGLIQQIGVSAIGVTVTSRVGWDPAESVIAHAAGGAWTTQRVDGAVTGPGPSTGSPISSAPRLVASN